MSEAATAVRIKGMRDGLLVSLPEGEWGEQSSILLAQIDARQAFFQGARLALDVGAQVIKVNEMVELRDQLSERSVSLWAVISESPTTEKTAQLLGLATRISKPRPEEQPTLDVGNVPEETALLLNRTIRSGTRIEFAGSIVVIGDVNPGAELEAHGSVIIWGRLRGAAHAGSGGDISAIVCALDLSPMRLQIASQKMPITERKEIGKPEIAMIRDGVLRVEAWQPGGIGQA